MSESGTPRVALAIVAQANCDSWEPLEQMQEAVAALKDSLTDEGGLYVHCLPELIGGGTKAEVEGKLGAWLRSLSERDRAVVYWTGHGTGSYLVTRESPKVGLAGDVAFKGSAFGDLIANSKAEKILVIVDACYASAEAEGIVEEILAIRLRQSRQPGQVPWVGVIPSASAHQKATEAVFCRTLLDVLTAPEVPVRKWSDNDDYIDVNELANALIETLLGELGDRYQEPTPASIGRDAKFLPNPRYRGPQPAMDVETRRRLLAVPAALGLAARGIEAGEAGFYFSGRIAVLERLASWLGEKEPGLLILTGPPGSGKSAVLGRVVTLSDPSSRGVLEEAGAPFSPDALPPEGSVGAAVHVKGMGVAEFVAAIADDAGVELPAGLTADALVQTLHERALVLVVDALDEASEPFEIGLLVGRLVSEAGVRVVVGVRRSPDGRVLAVGEERHGRLRALFGEEAEIRDLEDEPGTATDIAAYVSARLSDSRHAGDPDGIGRVAARVAEQADGVFLYARIVSRSLQDAEGLEGPLPAGAQAAFAADLETRFGDRREQIDELLAALAWAQGAGLSRRAWPRVATAASATGASYEDRDVAWALDRAGWHILEAGEHGQGVYRLAHQQLAEYYWRRAPEAGAVHERISLALADGVSGAGWLEADGYLRRHLADHAAQRGTLDRFVLESGYLAVADPARLLPALHTLQDPLAQRIGGIYQRAASDLYAADPIERMAILHLTAHKEDPELAPRLEPLVQPRWQTRWAKWQPTGAHRRLSTGHRGGVTSVAVGELAGEPVIVSGGYDGTVRIWDAASGRPHGEPLRGHERAVTSVAVGALAGEVVIVSGSYDGTVRIWDAASGRPHGEPLRGHEGGVASVAVGELAGAPVIVSGGEDGTVRIWEAASGRPHGEPLRGHDGGVQSVALGDLAGEPMVVSGGEDGTVRIWEAASGRPHGEPLRGHDGGVRSVALGELAGEPVIVSGNEDGRVWIWNAASDEPQGERLEGHDGWVASVALGELAGEPVIVSGGWDGTVRIWDAAGGRPHGEPLGGHDGGVQSVAVGELKGETVIVSGGWDATVRIWNAASRRPQGEPLRGHEGGVSSVAVGELAGEPVIVSGASDGTVRVWNAGSGQPQGRPLAGHEGSVLSVAVGELAGEPVIVSGSNDGTVRIWNAASGRPHGEPLRGHWDPVSSVALGELEGETVIVSGGWDATVRIWNAASRRPQGEPLVSHEGGVLSVAMGELAGETVIVSGASDGTVRVWNAGSGQPQGRPLAGHEGSVLSVAVGELAGEPVIVSGSKDGTVRIWNAATGRPQAEPLRGHEGSVVSVAVGELAGKLVIVSGSEDATVRIWNARGGEPLLTMPMGTAVAQVATGEGGIVAVALTRGVACLTVATPAAGTDE